jgi:ubiquinone/menaquinone biosynthesis C-methylase UbiE
MGFYQDRIVPLLVHLAMSNPQLAGYRQRTIASARGRVLEIGIGSGHNLPLYSGEVSAVCGIDPSAALLRRARAHGAPNLVLVNGSAETIPFESGIFNTVVTTWTLCSIPHAHAALREMSRVLRRDGTLLFVEHGLAPDDGVARWQNRLTPCWKCFAGGCHLNRKIDDLIEESGFRIERLDKGYLRGPNPLTYMYEGIARPAH